MEYGLKDKVVLINGATGGIGQALVKKFAAEGCKLAISSTSQAKLDAFVPTLGLGKDRLATFVADVTEEEQVKAFVDGAEKYFGHIDTVIPNAGYEGEYQLIQDATIESYMAVYKVNVFGVMFLLKYAAPYLISQGHGSVVVIASNGSYTTAAGMSAYCSSKHACAGIAKSVALELGPHGIHCNYICPGGVDTPMSIFRLLNEYKVEQLTDTKVVGITDAGVEVETAEGRRVLPADVIVSAFGQAQSLELADAVQNKYPTKTTIIGDCMKPAKAGNAIREGFYAAMSLQ